MSEELQKSEPSKIQRHDSFEENWNKELAKALILLKSQFLPPVYKTPEQVVAVIMKGRELKLPPMEALQNLFPVAGRIGMTTQLMAALVRKTGELEEFKVEDDGETATVTVKRKNMQPIVTQFSMKDAMIAGLANKDNWKHYPKQCRVARACAINYRLSFPDALSGLGYTPEELGAIVEYADDGHEEVLAIPQREPAETYSQINSALVNAQKSLKLDDIIAWKNLWEDEIKKLPDNLKEMIGRAYLAAIKPFNKETQNVDRSSEKVAENGNITTGEPIIAIGTQS